MGPIIVITHMKATFVMSNVIPQPHRLNAGQWENLEADIAGRVGRGGGWAERYGSVTVINGPVYNQRPATRQLRNRTWIPDACFSVVLRQENSHWTSLAFEMPNASTVTGPVSRYLTTVQTINRETGLDLLAGLPEPEKTKLEVERSSTIWR